jgi:hypothetical protein
MDKTNPMVKLLNKVQRGMSVEQRLAQIEIKIDRILKALEKRKDDWDHRCG